MAAVTACAVAGPVMADSIGPAGFPFGDFFTPPLSASQSTSVPISYHVTFGFGDWAGVHFSTIIDPTEANFTGFTPAQGFNTTGAAGSVTVWLANASNSGQSVFTSVPIPLGSLVLHAKGATPLKNNGDIDVVFQKVFNIFHVAPATTQSFSTTTGLIGTWLYLPPAVPVSLWGQGTPPQVGDGVWVQLTAKQQPLQLNLSWFWGTSFFFDPGASGGIGIENVPAPASVAILIGGFGAFGFARRRRRV
ncbi:MAG: PEP-CTERM sorting domain-containing protein [Planctomycetes bacterium]|nr:PEP-CTERM sorting domain-containing protein [Planctomycetota bacterium]